MYNRNYSKNESYWLKLKEIGEFIKLTHNTFSKYHNTKFGTAIQSMADTDFTEKFNGNYYNTHKNKYSTKRKYY